MRISHGTYIQLKSDTNSVHQELAMLYPPENKILAEKNNREIVVKLIARLIIPIGLAFLLI